ncbi:hypothetical protein P7C71_g3935, partial [Lecanoromycetidae sp. Uapishka_2]
MAENSQEDDFDIDIYGDGDGGQGYQPDTTEDDPKSEESPETAMKVADPEPKTSTILPSTEEALGQATEPEGILQGNDVAQKIASTDQSGSDPVHLPKQAPQTQGLKRKDGEDDRFVDPGATTALFVSELHWWVNDDDVRGWANQSQCEDELLEITFSEHKVNGKSKGQSYILFKSPQAATAAKHKIESFGEGQQYTKKFTVSYTNPYTNPFKTLPKDGPMRNNAPANNNRSNPGTYGGTGMSSQNIGYNNSGGYRGSRGGGYNNRGGLNNMGGYNRGGFQQPATGGFQGGMSGFQGANMGSMQPYGGYQNRGGMAGGMRAGPMGMRGGRGSMNGIMGMPMNGMAMGTMGSMGMSTQPHFNPAFFPQQQQGQQSPTGDSNWNPHGAKRTRQE